MGISFCFNLGRVPRTSSTGTSYKPLSRRSYVSISTESPAHLPLAQVYHISVNIVMFQSRQSPPHLFHDVKRCVSCPPGMFQSRQRGVQVTHLWKAGIFPIVGRVALREKQEQVTCQLKSTPSFDQKSSKELMAQTIPTLLGKTSFTPCQKKNSSCSVSQKHFTHTKELLL